jgi:hypothetical protein
MRVSELSGSLKNGESAIQIYLGLMLLQVRMREALTYSPLPGGVDVERQ